MQRCKLFDYCNTLPRVTMDFAFVMVWQVDPVVYNMLHEDPGNVSYSAVGGLSDQIRELRESIELPLMNPELFLRVGIKPPKVIVCVSPFSRSSDVCWYLALKVRLRMVWVIYYSGDEQALLLFIYGSTKCKRRRLCFLYF